jgi:hypothetical protein
MQQWCIIECESYEKNLRSARILRLMPFQWQANSQKISGSELEGKQGRDGSKPLDIAGS